MRANVNVTVAGVEQVRAAIREFGRDIEKQVTDAVNATGLETISDVKRSIQSGPKTGRIYRRGTVEHRASAPGQAPAPRHGGRLVSSIYFKRIGKYTAAIGSPLDYAQYLEFGTMEMEPRPSWIPAAEKNAPRLEKRFLRIIREASARANGKTK